MCRPLWLCVIVCRGFFEFYSGEFGVGVVCFCGN